MTTKRQPSKYPLTEEEKNFLNSIEDWAARKRARKTIYHKKWRNDKNSASAQLYLKWHTEWQKNTLRHCVACNQTYRIDIIKVHMTTQKHLKNVEIHNTNEIKKLQVGESMPPSLKQQEENNNNSSWIVLIPEPTA